MASGLRKFHQVEKEARTMTISARRIHSHKVKCKRPIDCIFQVICWFYTYMLFLFEEEFFSCITLYKPTGIASNTIPKAAIVSPFSEIVWNLNDRTVYGQTCIRSKWLHSSHIMCNVVTTECCKTCKLYIYVCLFPSVSVCACYGQQVRFVLTCLTTCITERFSFPIPLRCKETSSSMMIIFIIIFIIKRP